MGGLTIRGGSWLANCQLPEKQAERYESAVLSLLAAIKPRAGFGLELTHFGPSYSCTMMGNVGLGPQGDMAKEPEMPLPVVLVDDIEAAQTGVNKAGGTISKPVFAFPGGRCFHFLDPNGLELAIMHKG